MVYVSFGYYNFNPSSPLVAISGPPRYVLTRLSAQFSFASRVVITQNYHRTANDTYSCLWSPTCLLVPSPSDIGIMSHGAV